MPRIRIRNAHLEYLQSKTIPCLCQYCGVSFCTNRTRFKHNVGTYCSRACGFAGRKAQSRQRNRQRFWDKVQRCTHEPWCPYCCWPWAGVLEKNGYARFHLTKKERRGAHRLAWELFNGRIIPDYLHACHWCHTPACCNPFHVYPATQAENLAHSRRDGRMTQWDAIVPCDGRLLV